MVLSLGERRSGVHQSLLHITDLISNPKKGLCENDPENEFHLRSCKRRASQADTLVRECKKLWLLYNKCGGGSEEKANYFTGGPCGIFIEDEENTHEIWDLTVGKRLSREAKATNKVKGFDNVIIADLNKLPPDPATVESYLTVDFRSVLEIYKACAVACSRIHRYRDSMCESFQELSIHLNYIQGICALFFDDWRYSRAYLQAAMHRRIRDDKTLHKDRELKLENFIREHLNEPSRRLRCTVKMEDYALFFHEEDGSLRDVPVSLRLRMLCKYFNPTQEAKTALYELVRWKKFRSFNNLKRDEVVPLVLNWMPSSEPAPEPFDQRDRRREMDAIFLHADLDKWRNGNVDQN